MHCRDPVKYSHLPKVIYSSGTVKLRGDTNAPLEKGGNIFPIVGTASLLSSSSIACGCISDSHSASETYETWQPVKAIMRVTRPFAQGATALATQFIRRLNEHATHKARRIVTDKLRAYRQACADLLPDAQHITDKAQNNRAENSHQPTRIRERQMKGFKSMAHAQGFLTIFSAISNLFDIGSHLLTAENRRCLQAQRWREWQEITQGGGT